MPKTVRTIGRGGLSHGDRPLGVTNKQLTIPTARKWLESAEYILPAFVGANLGAFLLTDNRTYGFLDHGDFYNGLLEYSIAQAAHLGFTDYIFNTLQNYNVTFTPIVRMLLRNLEPDTPLFVGDGSVTAEDLFCLSVLFEKEVAVFTSAADPWQKLYVGVGSTTVIRGVPGYRFVLHTHPTMSDDTGQIKDDLTKAVVGTVELVVTGTVIFYYARNHLFNETNTARGYRRATGMARIGRETAITVAMLRTNEAELIAAMQEATKIAEEKEREEIEAYRGKSKHTVYDLGFLDDL